VFPKLAITFGVVAIFAAVACGQDNWPENRGPSQNYHLNSAADIPQKWSVTRDENVLWRMPLPETGHSGIAVWDNRLFLTCFKKLKLEDTTSKGTWAAATVGYCLDANSGEILWSCELPGKRPNQVNGVFTDSTTPTPVTDGKHVWFVSAGGYFACHALDGKRVWAKEFEVRTKHSAKQFQPFLHEGNLYYVMMRDRDDPARREQTAKDYDKNSKTGWPWMFVRSFNALTGEPNGVIEQGISVHSKGALGMLNGEKVLLHARGGGHSPPEKPYGIGLSKLNATHDLVWERPGLYFEGSHYIDEKHAYCFDNKDFYVLDLATGETLKKIQIRGSGRFIAYDEKRGVYTKSENVPKLHARNLQTHRSNIGVGKYHFFMSSIPGVLGRVNIETEELCYLQVPLQVTFEDDKKTFSWTDFQAGDDTGSGFVVSGDKRRLGHGFGHLSAATPVVLNGHIYFTTMLGTVYVIDASAENFDQTAIVSVNDLGPPGKTWTLSPFTTANGKLYQRTSREIICIGSR